MTQKDPKIKFFSVVIPAYSAEKFIYNNLKRVKEVLDNIGYDYEIICVVDGKVDDTYKEAKKFAKKFPKLIKIEGYENNLGKGHAVRYGMSKAKGDVIAFIDAGIELDTNGLALMLEHFKWYGADIIIGSKRHQASKVVYPWQRRILSFGYQMLVRILFGLKVKDTQVGLKVFKRDVLKKIIPRLLVKKFAFDIEMLSVANSLGYKKIYEAPVELKMEFKGGVSTIASKGFLRTIFFMAWDTAAVFYRLKILRYYEDGNSKNWRTSEYLKIKE